MQYRVVQYSVPVSTPEKAMAKVVNISRERQAKDAELDEIRERQYAAIREALEAGATAYAIAKASGLTQRAIHRIRDGEIGRS